MQRLEERGRDLRALGHLKLAAIGPSTADVLAGFHLRADLVPDSYRSEALAEALGQVASGRKILLARADRGRTLLKDELDQSGRCPAGERLRKPRCRIPARLGHRANPGRDGRLDHIDELRDYRAPARAIAGRGSPANRTRGPTRAVSSPVTSATAVRLGWNVAVEAREFTWDGLVNALVQRIAEDRLGLPHQSHRHTDTGSGFAYLANGRTDG